MPLCDRAFVTGELSTMDVLALMRVADVTVGGVGWIVPAALAMRRRAFIVLGGNGGQVVIRKGWNDLNGEQALMFVRERYQLSEGDISRGKRQMAFIKALMTKAISTETITNPVMITGCAVWAATMRPAITLARATSKVPGR